MVFESTTEFPTPEGAERRSPPPLSTYGFQKLATEYFAKGALEQYSLPYTIARPFNCVGIGERRALRDSNVTSGNVRLAMSHVVPDWYKKSSKGQEPLHILGSGSQVRHYTYGGDLARGIRMCIEHPAALERRFQSLLDSRRNIGNRTQPRHLGKNSHKGGKPFRYVSDSPYEYDVQMRSPDVSKADRVLGFRAETSLDKLLDEVIPWIAEQIRHEQISNHRRGRAYLKRFRRANRILYAISSAHRRSCL